MTDTWIDRNRNLLFAGLVVVTLSGAGGLYFSRPPTQEPIEIVPITDTPTPLPSTPTPTPTPGPIRVYITGAVANSDVYELPPGSIIKDVILAAGGLAAEADIVGINQAQEVKDQQHVHVPAIGEENPPPPVQDGEDEGGTDDNGGDVAPSPALININKATLDQLDTLPGIGPAIAQRIIEYRESQGEFKSIEGIMEVSGIGESTFNKIKALITLE
ncbi:MAG: helix-hairpin-helix domain-containing protein [Chloroflexota bacterium]